jgi:hypothetical protein
MSARAELYAAKLESQAAQIAQADWALKVDWPRGPRRACHHLARHPVALDPDIRIGFHRSNEF